MYVDLRKKFLPAYANENPTIEKAISLLSSNNPGILFNLAVYIYKAMLMRDKALKSEQ